MRTIGDIRFVPDTRIEGSIGIRITHIDREGQVPGDVRQMHLSQCADAIRDGNFSALRIGRYWWGFALYNQQLWDMMYIGYITSSREYKFTSPLELPVSFSDDTVLSTIVDNMPQILEKVGLSTGHLTIIPETEGVGYIPGMQYPVLSSWVYPSGLVEGASDDS